MRSVPTMITAAAAAGAMLLAGCATDTGTAAPDSEERQELFDEQCADTVIPDLPDLEPVPVDEGAGDEDTAQVDSEFGTVELPTAPQAALGMYTTDVDILIWLGFELADSQPIRGDGGYSTFPCFFPYEPLADVDTFANYPDYDYEGVLAAEPDFILNGLGYDKKTVKRLPQIAPTYSLNAFDGESWQIHFEETAKALGREDRYQMWKKIYDERIVEVKEAIGDTAQITVAPVAYWEDAVQTSCASGVECQVFADLGLEIAPAARANDNQGSSLSAEQVGQLSDVDWAFTIKNLGEVGDEAHAAFLEEVGENPLWNELSFVQEERIVTYEFEMTFGSPSGQLAFLDVVEEALAP